MVVELVNQSPPRCVSCKECVQFATFNGIFDHNFNFHFQSFFDEGQNFDSLNWRDKRENVRVCLRNVYKVCSEAFQP